MNMSGDRTISFWINFASIAADQIIMGDWGASAATQYWRLYFDDAWYVGGQPTIGLRLGNGSSEASPISNTTITANTWYWVCVRYNATTHEVKMSTLHSGGGGTNVMTYAPQSRNSAFRIGLLTTGRVP